MTSHSSAAKSCIYLDIETQITDDRATMLAIGDKNPLPTGPAPVVVDARLKDPDKIEADRVAKQAKAEATFIADLAATKAKALDDLRKTSLSASAGGRIFSIACAVGEGDVVYYDSRTDGEAWMLESFLRDLSRITHDEIRGAKYLKSGLPSIIRPTVVAHFAHFDVDFIWMRAKILNVPIPAWWPKNAAAWDIERVYDTMFAWAGVRDRISLNALCKLLGLPGKGFMDGGNVQDLIDAGRGDEVLHYNAEDVRRLRSVHRRIIGLRPLDNDIIALGGVPEKAPAPEPVIAKAPTIDPYALMPDPLAGWPIDETDLATEEDL